MAETARLERATLVGRLLSKQLPHRSDRLQKLAESAGIEPTTVFSGGILARCVPPLGYSPQKVGRSGGS